MKGLIFTAESVRGILAGTKTQTRRIIAQAQHNLVPGARLVRMYDDGSAVWGDGHRFRAPLRVGDTAYVKETWAPADSLLDAVGRVPAQCIAYRDETARYCRDSVLNDWTRVDTRNWGWSKIKWRSPLMMPEWASRATLRITDVRVQRASAISEDDARAEGFQPDQTVAEWVGITRPRSPEQLREAGLCTAADRFLDAWTDMHGEQARDAWVWAYTFEVLR